jgi:hypothetical protein
MVPIMNICRGTYLRPIASVALPLPLPGVCGSRPACCLFPLCFLLGVLSYLDHPFIMALHAIDALARLRKDKFVDTILADLALEAVRMVRIVTGHDCLVKNGVVADVAAVGAVCADRRAIGEQEEICVCSDLVSTLCAFETIDMEERLAGKRVKNGRNGSKQECQRTQRQRRDRLALLRRSACILDRDGRRGRRESRRVGSLWPA